MELGYACLNCSLKDCKPNRRTTVGYLKKLNSEGQITKLNSLLFENLANTLRILRFNVAHDINFYRLSSDIVPLATHPVTEGWDYITAGKEQFLEIGEFIKNNNLRVSMHPGQYTVLNSNKDDVVDRAIADLEYHSQVLQTMRLDTSHKLILHIGGVYGDKKAAITRFKENFCRLSTDIKGRLVIENDDKSYQAREVLKIAQELDIPMVFDNHHFNCNHSADEKLEELIPAIFATWGSEKPKMHFSSPKNEDKYASHADNINAQDFKKFIDLITNITDEDFDIMLECKNKDQALFKLREELDYRWD
ncbi:UV damage endonuclease UvdE [Halobacteroides halobius DSM 5150]|uniref:UV damage endonuclease UvdE n=1 Tax=Halobacteroides halobius (strain ATCC 35273 / DSM 5150 / MD-1) TaxID=748449 RepID=L0K7P6_HALHC|nr:UV DNA damage repair endonuclease UvsE [Halobacteroides halobius]AGB40369.1 UV damage endonuclease UvdE [Halobacteroides halobius DSM 5150]